ncbi:hypothetical protein DFO54_104278 [Erwinia sp. AG740]|nr:hypothetical protein DFO54_104278 [Erwinia sp. AG740]
MRPTPCKCLNRFYFQTSPYTAGIDHYTRLGIFLSQIVDESNFFYGQVISMNMFTNFTYQAQSSLRVALLNQWPCVIKKVLRSAHIKFIAGRYYKY